MARVLPSQRDGTARTTGDAASLLRRTGAAAWAARRAPRPLQRASSCGSTSLQLRRAERFSSTERTPTARAPTAHAGQGSLDQWDDRSRDRTACRTPVSFRSTYRQDPGPPQNSIPPPSSGALLIVTLTLGVQTGRVELSARDSRTFARDGGRERYATDEPEAGVSLRRRRRRCGRPERRALRDSRSRPEGRLRRPGLRG